MTRETCWTSIPRARRSVAIRTREDPDRNSFMMTSRSDCCISPSERAKRKKEKVVSSRSRRGRGNATKPRLTHGGDGELPGGELLSEPVDLSLGVAEDDGLGDGDGLVEIGEGIELPVLLLDGDVCRSNGEKGQQGQSSSSADEQDVEKEAEKREGSTHRTDGYPRG